MHTPYYPTPPYDVYELPNYEVAILVGVGLDPKADNVDVEVRLESGQRLAATFFTIRNIEQLMANWETSGECNKGSYFWSKNAIIVRVLTKEVILETIAALYKEGELEVAFERLAESS